MPQPMLMSLNHYGLQIRAILKIHIVLYHQWPLNYSKMPWIYEYNLTSQDVTQFGQGAGINGDIYFFLSETRYHRGNHVFSLWF